jgi:hypothetical protein
MHDMRDRATHCMVALRRAQPASCLLCPAGPAIGWRWPFVIVSVPAVVGELRAPGELVCAMCTLPVG